MLFKNIFLTEVISRKVTKMKQSNIRTVHEPHEAKLRSSIVLYEVVEQTTKIPIVSKRRLVAATMPLEEPLRKANVTDLGGVRDDSIVVQEIKPIVSPREEQVTKAQTQKLQEEEEDVIMGEIILSHVKTQVQKVQEKEEVTEYSEKMQDQQCRATVSKRNVQKDEGAKMEHEHAESELIVSNGKIKEYIEKIMQHAVRKLSTPAAGFGDDQTFLSWIGEAETQTMAPEETKKFTDVTDVLVNEYRESSFVSFEETGCEDSEFVDKYQNVKIANFKDVDSSDTSEVISHVDEILKCSVLKTQKDYALPVHYYVKEIIARAALKVQNEEEQAQEKLDQCSQHHACVMSDAVLEVRNDRGIDQDTKNMEEHVESEMVTTKSCKDSGITPELNEIITGAALKVQNEESFVHRLIINVVIEIKNDRGSDQDTKNMKEHDKSEEGSSSDSGAAEFTVEVDTGEVGIETKISKKHRGLLRQIIGFFRHKSNKQIKENEMSTSTLDSNEMVSAVFCKDRRITPEIKAGFTVEAEAEESIESEEGSSSDCGETGFTVEADEVTVETKKSKKHTGLLRRIVGRKSNNKQTKEKEMSTSTLDSDEMVSTGSCEASEITLEETKKTGRLRQLGQFLCRACCFGRSKCD